jgi:hypothetical protein
MQLLRNSLDGDVREDLGKKSIFKRLEGNWYLYLSNEESEDRC